MDKTLYIAVARQHLFTLKRRPIMFPLLDVGGGRTKSTGFVLESSDANLDEILWRIAGAAAEEEHGKAAGKKEVLCRHELVRFVGI
jgi:hypothetical protein